MRKILFLDIDGVLNSKEWFKQFYEDKHKTYDPLDPNLVKKLNSLDCEVVISSSWGMTTGVH